MMNRLEEEEEELRRASDWGYSDDSMIDSRLPKKKARRPPWKHTLVLDKKLLVLSSKPSLSWIRISAQIADEDGNAPHPRTANKRLKKLLKEYFQFAEKVLTPGELRQCFQRVGLPAPPQQQPAPPPPQPAPPPTNNTKEAIVYDEDDIFSEEEEQVQGEKEGGETFSRVQLAAEFAKYDQALEAANAAFSALDASRKRDSVRTSHLYKQLAQAYAILYDKTK